MKGDFSRSTFDARHRFSRVLMQQGRVLLDADWNEQTAILLHYIRTLAADLIGRHGGPGDGFRIGCIDEDRREHHCDLTIGWGHYYVDGILVENLPPVRCPPGEVPAPLRYTAQPDYPLTPDDELEEDTDYLVYLDVWERHLTHLEVDHIREVALGGPDTATRARVVWQVRVAREDECGHDQPEDAGCEELLRALVRGPSGCLRARARVEEPSDDPCIIPPEARYRGAENQLYRVEIHGGGEAGDARRGATFKWSRDNGSVVFAVRGIRGDTISLDSLGPDPTRSLKEGDWVELIDDHHVLRGEHGFLARVDAVDRVRFQVTLAASDEGDLPAFHDDRHPLLRRWDHGSDAIPVREGQWIDLEDGVQVYFQSDGGRYRTGDYWLIPARTATGDVLWPGADSASGGALPPHGIQHHYAPLARVRITRQDDSRCDDCRCRLEPLCVHDEQDEAAEEEDREDGPDRPVPVPVPGPAPTPRPTERDTAEEVRRREEIVAELRTINDVGRARANVLIAEGHDTPAAVARLSAEELRTLLNVSDTVATRIREHAVALAGERQ